MRCSSWASHATASGNSTTPGMREHSWGKSNSRVDGSTVRLSEHPLRPSETSPGARAQPNSGVTDRVVGARLVQTTRANHPGEEMAAGSFEVGPMCTDHTGGPERMVEGIPSKASRQASGHHACACLLWPFPFPWYQQSRRRRGRDMKGRETRREGGVRRHGEFNRSTHEAAPQEGQEEMPSLQPSPITEV